MEALILTANLAFTLNVPLGLWRANTRKLSWQWFLALHLAVPAVVVLRLTLGVPLIYIPLLIAVAVSGQMVGGVLVRRARLKPVEYPHKSNWHRG